MIANEEWARIRGYTDQVVNREADEILFHGGRVRREPGGSVNILLSGFALNLEPYPDPENIDVTDDVPCGPGWPD